MTARARDSETGNKLIFITNNFDLAVNTIAEIYRDRWQIECFFKELKQNLKIKTFVGTSRNALFAQIWTALISCYNKERPHQGIKSVPNGYTPQSFRPYHIKPHTEWPSSSLFQESI